MFFLIVALLFLLVPVDSWTARVRKMLPGVIIDVSESLEGRHAGGRHTDGPEAVSTRAAWNSAKSIGNSGV